MADDVTAWLTAKLGWCETAAAGSIFSHSDLLRRVVADRKILALHEPYASLGVVRCREDGLIHDLYPCRTVQLLAEAWGWEQTP